MLVQIQSSFNRRHSEISLIQESILHACIMFFFSVSNKSNQLLGFQNQFQVFLFSFANIQVLLNYIWKVLQEGFRQTSALVCQIKVVLFHDTHPTIHDPRIHDSCRNYSSKLKLRRENYANEKINFAEQKPQSFTLCEQKFLRNITGNLAVCFQTDQHL